MYLEKIGPDEIPSIVEENGCYIGHAVGLSLAKGMENQFHNIEFHFSGTREAQEAVDFYTYFEEVIGILDGTKTRD